MLIAKHDSQFKLSILFLGRCTVKLRHKQAGSLNQLHKARVFNPSQIEGNFFAFEILDWRRLVNNFLVANKLPCIVMLANDGFPGFNSSQKEREEIRHQHFKSSDYRFKRCPRFHGDLKRYQSWVGRRKPKGSVDELELYICCMRFVYLEFKDSASAWRIDFVCEVLHQVDM